MSQIDEMVHNYSASFEGRFSQIECVTCSHRTCTAIFIRNGEVPYAFRSHIEKELDSLENPGIITPIETSNCNFLLAITLKLDGTLRLRGLQMCREWFVFIKFAHQKNR